MKKGETEVGSWRLAQIPGSNRPLESHYGQTLLQHFPKERGRKNAGSREGGEYTVSVYLSTRTCVCVCARTRITCVFETWTYKIQGGKKKTKETMTIMYRKPTYKEIL